MSTYDYTFSLASFPTGVVATDRLAAEVQASSITVALARVDTLGPNCLVRFKAQLSVGEEAVLQAIVAAHTGVPLESDPVVVTLDGPKEDDRKPLVTFFPGTQGMKAWIVGAADTEPDPPNHTGRAEGDPFVIEFAAGENPRTEARSYGFNEPIELHDGQIVWNPAHWDYRDSFSLGVLIEANVVTPADGDGNANVVPQLGLIVPAPGTGAYNVDLSQATPTPSFDKNGYWEVDQDTGVVSPSATPGHSAWHLLVVPVTSWMIRKVRTAHPLGVFDIDVYKTERFHPRWKLRWEVTKVSPSAGVICGWVFAFRKTPV